VLLLGVDNSSRRQMQAGAAPSVLCFARPILTAAPGSLLFWWCSISSQIKGRQQAWHK
jgi:hypothetical protein